MRCPKCGQKVIAKAQGKRAAYHEDRETCQVIRQISPQELVVRIYKLYWSYAKGKDTIRKSAYEVMRIFVRSDNGKDATMEPYYYDSGYDSVTHWRYGYRPGALFGMACFSSEETGTVYLPGLEKALQGTPWEYCALRQFYEQTGIPMQVSYYLKMYLQHPLLVERLTKVGYKNIVSDVVYRNGFSDALDETQTKTHRILRVQKEDVSFLREKNADMAMLKKYQSYVAINLRGRKELFQWKIDNKVAEISTDVFRYMTAEKFMHYMEAQLPIYCDTRPANRYREPTMKTLVTMYVDYLHMCRRQAYDMKDKSVLFPKNCAAAHDREAERIQKINDAQKKKAFCMAYAGFARKAALSNKELQIVCPKQANDLVDEGKALHHCVGGYCIVAGEEQPVKKKLVLVFDDFERCKIGVIDLLGIINTYVEDKRIKTIVIASEDNIEDEENYKTFKEKVVERTVKLDMEYRRIQQEMIEDYKTETSEYKEFLKKESPKLFQVFEESGSRNLRTFKSCLIDFERVYGLWHSLKLPTDGMGEAL